MVLILLTVLSLLMVNFGNGVVIRNVFNIESRSFASVSFLGMIAITIFETIFAFFFPLNSLLEIFLIAVGLFGSLWSLRKEKVKLSNLKFDFWFYFFLLVIIFSASFAPHLFDHYSYYVPTISYLKELGFIKGVSSFDLLLGQSSFWHIYQAGFSHFVDPFLKINAYIIVLFLIYLYERKQLFLLIFIPPFLLFVQQPSPDLPIVIITLIVINELINKRESPIVLYLSLFAFCIKPIAFWLPLFVVSNYIYQRKFGFRIFVPIAFFAVLSVLKNLWLFGFPIFPVSSFDFNLPWKPSQEILDYSSQIGLMKTYDMKYSYQQVIYFNSYEKIYHWFTVGYKSILNVGVVFSLIIISIFAFKKKEKFYYFLFLCLILKSVLIFTFSAQYRFFIDVYVIAIFLLFRNISENSAITFGVSISVFISVLFLFPGFLKQYKIGERLSDFHFSQIYKPRETELVIINQEHKIGNFKFRSGKSLYDKFYFPTLSLYDLELYDYYGIIPQQIGKNYKNGFFQRKLTLDEKIQLKKIIAETKKSQP